jgi:hypothetical protein
MTKLVNPSNRAALEKRENEILRIMRQMQSDNLQHSPVFQKLKEELQDLKMKQIQAS